MRRLIVDARRYWPHVISIMMIDLLSAPIVLLTPLPLKIVVDSIVGTEPLPAFLSAIVPDSWASPSQLLGLAVGLFLFTAVLTQIRGLAAALIQAYAGGSMVLDFRARLFHHAQRLSLAYHDMKGVSDTLYRVQYDTAAVQNVLIGALIPMIVAVATVFSMLYVTLRINTQLALIALSISPVILVLTRAYRLPLRRKWRNQKRLEQAALSVVTEVFSALRVVKAFSQEQREQSRYEGRATAGLTEKLRLTLLQGSYGMVATLTTSVGSAIVLFFGVKSIQAGTMSVGDLLIVMTYLGMLYAPLKTIGHQVGALQGYLTSAERAFSLMDERPDVLEKPDALPLLRASGEIEFQDVAFGYTESSPVVQEVSINVPAGSRVGVVGKTGAGKTTLLSLLMRFYDPTDGQILLDGVDLRDYKTRDLRRQFAMVLQDTILFSTTIRENIAYARPDATETEIEDAARSAQAHEFISCFTDGYDTMVGDRGMRLSGGERQRIALARAFLRDAPILLFDEPTSAVDTTTEAAIIEVMDRLMAGRTTFIVAHRLSTVESVDFVLEVKDGRVRRRDGDDSSSVAEPATSHVV